MEEVDGRRRDEASNGRGKQEGRGEQGRQGRQGVSSGAPELTDHLRSDD